MKQDWKPGTMIYPLPAVLVSCGSSPEEYNLITVAWTGTLCTNPPMCYISVRPERCFKRICCFKGKSFKNVEFQTFLRNKTIYGIQSRRYDCFNSNRLNSLFNVGWRSSCRPFSRLFSSNSYMPIFSIGCKAYDFFSPINNNNKRYGNKQ